MFLFLTNMYALISLNSLYIMYAPYSMRQTLKQVLRFDCLYIPPPDSGEPV